jgi:hypothetical protein
MPRTLAARSPGRSRAKVIARAAKVKETGRRRQSVACFVGRRNDRHVVVGFVALVLDFIERLAGGTQRVVEATDE